MCLWGAAYSVNNFSRAQEKSSFYFAQQGIPVDHLTLNVPIPDKVKKLS